MQVFVITFTCVTSNIIIGYFFTSTKNKIEISDIIG